jgi:hypothetical protein
MKIKKILMNRQLNNLVVGLSQIKIVKVETDRGAA